MLIRTGIQRKNTRELFRLIDWLMVLPPPLDDSFWDDVTRIEEEKHMPFITTPERVGLRRGMRFGIQSLLRFRFGAEGLKLMPEIENIHYEEQLQTITTALETANGLEEIRRLLSSLSP